METAVKHRVSGAYRTVRAVVCKDGGEISPPPIRLHDKRNGGLSFVEGSVQRKSWMLIIKHRLLEKF